MTKMKLRVNFILTILILRTIDAFGSSKIVEENSLNGDFHKKKACTQNATCESLRYSTCYGVKLPYTSTSLSLVLDISTQDEVQERLSKWKVAMNIPRCWAVIQPFLCSLYMPRCEGGLVDLPSSEMCEKIKYPCRIFENDTYWREELFKCDKYYQSKCKNNVRELKFNTTGQCKTPLVRAERETSYFEGVEGCGIQCRDPFYTEEEYQDIRTWVKYGAWLSFACNLFAVLTFIIAWGVKYPTRAVFFMNVCFLLSSLGYVYQFLPWATEYTVCHKDGTPRTAEPSIRENIYCGLNFFFVYYFLVAGIIWFNIFAYTWYIRLKKIEAGMNTRSDKLIPYYHLTAWCLPFALTVIIVAFVGVDGDSLLGICFVGVVNKSSKIFFLGPLFFSVIGIIFFSMFICSLIRIKIQSDKVISVKPKPNICEIIVRFLIFLLLTIFFDMIIVFCYFYEFQHYHSWKESFRKYYIACHIGVGTDGEDGGCRMQHRPGAVMIQLLVIAVFGTHINVSTWLWTKSTMDIWSQFFRKLFNKELPEQGKLSKAEIIAKAYKKKDMLHSDCKFSVDIFKKGRDPVGIDFELNPTASNDFSSAWLDALPRLLRRRGAQTMQLNSESSSQRRSSVYSETSISVRRFSIESQKRNSCDSTVSVQAVEVTKTVRKGTRPKRNRKTRGKVSRKIKKKIFKNSNASPTLNDLELEVLAALNISPDLVNDSNQRMLNNRRPAITDSDIDENAMKLLSMINSDE